MPVLQDYVFDDLLSFTRATAGWRWTSAGVLEEVAAGAVRLDHDPDTLAARGVLIEQAAENLISNPRAEGAAAGTPGTAPSSWGFISTTGSGVTRTMAVGTEAGIPYVEFRYAGTATAANLVIVQVCASSAIAAVAGETLTGFAYLSVYGPALPNSTVLRITEINASVFTATDVSVSMAATAAALPVSDVSVTRAFTNGSTTHALLGVVCGNSNGQALDFTIRLGAPQLWKDDIAFSPSLPPVSTPGASTRNAEALELTDISNWFNATEGTFVIDFMPGQDANGSDQRGILRLDDGTANNRILVRMRGSNTDVRLSADVAGVQVFTADQASGAALARHTVRLSYGPSGYFLSVNGAAPQTGSGAVPTGLVRALLGRGDTSSTYLNGWLGPRVEFYPTQYTDTAGDDGFTIRTR